jgi:NAD(P)-dependent dehydrogenase (short-subunit alcohol dehydrogenase family)
VLITGASRGIGAAIARGCSEHGARVVMTARGEKDLAGLAADLPGECAYVCGNAGDPAHAEEAVATALDRFGGLDVLVNNAATNPYYGQLIDVDSPRLRKTLEVNLEGPLRFIQAAWRETMSQRGGVVLNIGSIGGYGFTGPVPVYDLTKAGLMHLTRRLAVELGPKVRVNAIAPGLIKTEFARALWENHENGDWSWPLRRLGTPTDVTGAAMYLVSDLSSWTTGAVLVVDGGALVAPSIL